MFLRIALIVGALAVSQAAAQQVSIAGPEGLRRWHGIALTLAGPASSESGTPNPFLDYRMNVTFSHAASGTTYVVPGHFAADGQAAETSASAGDRWRAWLSPDHVGTWRWSISFRTGSDVAISLDPVAGAPLAPFDGLRGSIEVLESDKTGRDHRGKGRLGYVNRHHLQFGDETWFLKAGADSPENLLAYEDFDNTPNRNNRRKTWAPHASDWQTGEPSWQNGKGTELIGALNYLASEGLNAFSFLTYSHNGDDENVYPHVDPNDRIRMDCSKLDQWDIVFTHADRKGLYLHFKTQETENDQDMDGGALGRERKLYYRELVSRFAYHLALNWNLGEENSNTSAQRVAFAQYIRDLDPYDHNIVVHTYPGQKNAVYTPLLGSNSELTGASLQSQASSVFADTRNWVQRSAAAGKAWVCANDEQGNANTGIKPDANDPSHDGVRAEVLWGNLMAGGAGIECYFGYAYAHSDLTCQDFRSRDAWWDQCRYALEFFTRERIPFHEMQNDDTRIGSGHCLAGAQHFVVYLENGGTTTLDLTGESGNFAVWWYDPRNGGALQQGGVTLIAGGGVRALGVPPSAATSDWAVLVRPDGYVAARVDTYGSGCAGSRGVPMLVPDGHPAIGNTDFGLRVIHARAAAPAVLLFGFTRSALPLGGGCALLVSGPWLISSTTDPGGVGTWPTPIPPLVNLLGFVVDLSAFVLDPQGAYSGMGSFTGGLEARLGR